MLQPRVDRVDYLQLRFDIQPLARHNFVEENKVKVVEVACASELVEATLNEVQTMLQQAWNHAKVSDFEVHAASSHVDFLLQVVVAEFSKVV